MAEFDYQDLVKATEGFSPSRLIGKGSHGSVYKGILLKENKVLAIKKSTIGIDHVSKDNSKKLENEICILSSLHDHHHQSPYIINFLGTSHEYSSRKLLVMEFMPNGSLHEMLHPAKTPPSWPKRVEIALQIARAVQFLHENNPLVIHRDIKSANVLFDENWNAKLADYGLAVSRVGSLSHQASLPAGTIGYMDPCYTTPSKLSTKTDVFSYGVVLLEIISSRKAIDVSKSPSSIVEWAVSSLIQKHKVPIGEICDPRIGLPPYMEGTIRNLFNVAARCVSSKEENRPCIGEVAMEINSFCLVERVKVVVASPCSWTCLVRSLILMRRQRRLAKKCKRKCEDYSEISKGKLLLREMLADVSHRQSCCS